MTDYIFWFFAFGVPVLLASMILPDIKEIFGHFGKWL